MSRLFQLLPVMCLLLVAPTRAAKDPVKERLRKLEYESRSRAKDVQATAITGCREVIANHAATREQKLKAYEYLARAYSTHREYDKAVATAGEMRERFPEDADVDRTGVFRAAGYYWSWQKRQEDAIGMLESFCARHTADGETVAEAQRWLAQFYDRTKQYAESHAAAKAAFQANPENAKSASTALNYMQRAASRLGDNELRYNNLLKCFEPRYFGALSTGEQAARREDYYRTLMALGRHEELRECFARTEKEESNPERAQRWCYLQADSYRAEEKWDEACAAYERVLTDHPLLHTWWDDAQWRITEILAKQEKGKEMLDAALTALDIAYDRATIERAAHFVVRALQLIDDDVGRANLFLAYQLHGPNGLDGDPGTDDDLLDPLADIKRPSYPARERAFAEARKAMGDDTASSVHRGHMFLYTGDTEKAIVHFANALRRCPIREWEDAMKPLIIKGLRPWRGHPVGLQPAVDFVYYGPAGPDGQDNTEDDLANPFTDIAILASAPRRGGRLTDDNAAALADLAGALPRIVSNSHEHRERRKSAVYGIERVFEAMISHDGQAARALALDQLPLTTDREFSKALLRLGSIAAKSGQLHLGEVHRFWRDVAAIDETPEHRIEGAARNDIWREFSRPFDYAKKLGSALVPIRLRALRYPELTGRIMKAVNPKETAPGLQVAYHEGEWDKLPDLYKEEPKKTGVAKGVNPDIAERKGNYALRFTGYVRIPRDGAYRFYLASDGSSKLYIGKTLAIDSDGQEGTKERRGAVTVKAGLHPITVLYLRGNGQARLSLSYETFAMPKQPIPPEAFCHTP